MLVYFQSEEDKNSAYAPKVAVVFGLFLIFTMILMLPLDVANRAVDGGLPMQQLWEAMYLTASIMAFGVVPFMMFYYEAEDPESRNWVIKARFVAREFKCQEMREDFIKGARPSKRAAASPLRGRSRHPV